MDKYLRYLSIWLYSMKKRKLLLKFLTFTVFVIPTSFALTSCSEYGDLSTATQTTDTTQIYPTFNNSQSGSIPTSIAQLNNSYNADFTYIDANQYSLKQNYQNYQDNTDFTQYRGDESQLKNDINYYAYLLWTQNSKAFNIESVNIANYSVASLDPDFLLQFNKTTVSFILEITISTIQDTSISIFGKDFNLLDNQTYNLKISVDNQVIKPIVNPMSDLFFLGWKVDAASFSFDNSTFNSYFAPTINSFSFAFHYKINDLTTKQDYLQMYQQYQNDILSISNTDLQTQISNKICSDYQTVLDYVEQFNNIFKILKTNPTVQDLISGIMPSVARILISAKILPSYLQPMIDEAFKTGNEQTPLIDIIIKYKDDIKQFLQSMLGTASSVIEIYLDMLKPGITKDSNDYKSLLSLLQKLQVNDDGVNNILFNDLLGVEGNSKTLVDIIYDVVNAITTASAKVAATNGTNPADQPVMDLLNIIFSKNTDATKNQTFFDILSSEDKTNFYNDIAAILGSANSQLYNIISLITANNQNFTTANMTSFVGNLSAVIDNIFGRNTDYQSFYAPNAYKNITFTNKFLVNPTINKTNQTISFSYQISFTLSKKVDLSSFIASFKKLMSTDAISAIIKQFTNTDLQAILGSIPIIGKNIEANVVQAILDLIPNNLAIGANSNEQYYKQNSLTITYSANNSPIWLNPIAVANDYKLGYSFAYNTNIKFDDPAFINSITKNYNALTNSVEVVNVLNALKVSIDFYYANFWSAIIKNVFLRDYDFFSVFNSDVVNPDKTIATIDTYSPDLYESNFVVTDNYSKINAADLANKFLPSDTNNYVNVSSAFSSVGGLYNWKDGIGASSLLGIKPVLSTDLKNTLANQFIAYNNNTYNSDKNNNLNFALSIIPTANFNLPLKIKQSEYNVNTDLNIRISEFEFNFYSPVKVYDTTSKTLVNSIHYTMFYVNAVDNAATTAV